MPKISVVMPVYNGEKYLREAIDSILAQTFKDFELIIVDDASTDRTAEIITSYSDERIVYLKNDKNLKISDTLNKGIENSHGEYIARMDADDVSLPERLEKQAEFLDTHKEVYLVGCSIEIFGEETENQKRTFSEDFSKVKTDMLFSSPFAHPSVMMRSSLFHGEKLKYRAEFNGLEDYVLFFEIAKSHKVCAIPDCLFKYRIHGGQITQNYSSDYTEKLMRFKAEQMKYFGVDLNEKELRAFTLTACIGDSDYFGVEFEDIVSAYKKIILKQGFYNNKAVKNILTDKFIMFSKYFICRKTDFDKYEKTVFSKKAVAIHKIKRLLKKPYLKIERIKTNIKTKKDRDRLINRDFTIISNNCYGGFVFQKYGIPYRTPTAGIIIQNDDYIKFCRNIKHYLTCELKFIPVSEAKDYENLTSFGKFPVAMLDDVEIDFVHYKTAEEAAYKWYKRAQRVNYDNIAFKFSKRNIATDKNAEEFLQLDLQNKICFLSEERDGAIYIPGLDQLDGDESRYIEKYFDTTEFINNMVRSDKKKQ